jgi:hypothetical protein
LSASRSIFAPRLGASDATASSPVEQLTRVSDLTKALAEASPEIQRQVFEAFDLRIAYGKVGRRIEISATVSDARCGCVRER